MKTHEQHWINNRMKYEYCRNQTVMKHLKSLWRVSLNTVGITKLHLDYFWVFSFCACVFQRCCGVVEAEHTHLQRIEAIRCRLKALCSRCRIILSTRCVTRSPRAETRVSGVTVSEPNLFPSSPPVITLWPLHLHHHPASRSSACITWIICSRLTWASNLHRRESLTPLAEPPVTSICCL